MKLILFAVLTLIIAALLGCAAGAFIQKAPEFCLACAIGFLAVALFPSTK